MKTVCRWTLSICITMLIISGCAKKDTSEKASKEGAKQEEAKKQPGPSEPSVLIEVNGDKYTREMANADLDRKLASIKGIPPEQLEEFRARAMDQMQDELVQSFVFKTILMAEVKKANITVAKEEVDQYMTKLKASIPTNMTFEGILKDRGITEEKVREDISSDIKISKLFSPVTNKVAVTEADVKDYMEKNKEMLAFPETAHARHILVKIEKTDDDKTKGEKKAKIEKLREDLVKGGDFAAIAKENSDCPSKERGGDLGRFTKGRMFKPFEDAAFSQATNAIGPVVETEVGYHVIQVLERVPAGTASKEEVSSVLLNQKMDSAIREYLGSLAQKADIKDHRPPRTMGGMPQMMEMPEPGPAPEPKR